jgi:site-specific recombinase XerD
VVIGERDSRQVAAVIADFLRAAEEGRARRVDGERYARDDVRALRGSLSHVASELGSRDIEAVRSWQVQALVLRLRDAGLSRGRQDAIVEALRSLYAYAIRRRLVKASPVIGFAPLAEDRLSAPEPELDSAPDVEPALTPTYAMLTLADRVATWTVRLILSAFVLLGVGLILGLA